MDEKMIENKEKNRKRNERKTVSMERGEKEKFLKKTDIMEKKER